MITPSTVGTLNADIAAAGPGGVVDFEPGIYLRTSPLLLTNGGQPGLPVTIRGNGAILRSNRANPWTPGAANGNVWFQVAASHLSFTGFAFENVGNGCFQLGAPSAGLTIEDSSAVNVQRFVENRIVAGQVDATIDGLTVRRVNVDYFTKSTVRLQYDTRNVLIEDVVGDARFIDGDNFAMGIQHVGTVHDVVHRRVVMKNSYDTKDGLYWNGDGFVSEATTYNLTFEDCRADSCTDGGWDLKGNGHVLKRCVAYDNKRNFRLWGNSTLEDCIGLNPRIRGGTGTQAQVHSASSGQVQVIRGLFSDSSPNTIVFDADQTSTLNVVSAAVHRNVGSTLFTKETNATVILGAVTETVS